MSSEARPRSPVKLIPAIVLIAVVGGGLGAGYYFASYPVGSASGLPTVTWSVNPLILSFSVQVGSVSALDTFTCSASARSLTLEAFSSQPNIITLTVSPSAISGCGPRDQKPVSVVVTAACTATALESGTCPGNYSGTVIVCVASYTCLKSALTVSITVVSEDLMDKSFTLLSPTLPADQTFVPLKTQITWRVNYTIVNTFSTAITSVVLSDHFAASLAVDTSTITFSAPAGSGAGVPSFTTSTGRQPQWRFTWSIGTLLPGQTATLAVNVFTTLDPKGNQLFIDRGLQILNSGATLKWIPPGLPMQSFTTLPVFVMAGNTVGAVVGIVTSAGTAAGSVTVTLSSGGVAVATISTSTVGFYDFGALSSGTYTISATTSTGTAMATVTVTAGAITTQNLST